MTLKNRYWAHFPFVVLLFVFALARPTTAATPTGLDLLDGAPFAVSPNDLQKIAGEFKPPAEADAIILKFDLRYHFNPDGTSDKTSHLVYKVLTPSGVKGWSGTSATWEPWHQDRPIIQARVISPDQTVHELDPTTLVEAGTGKEDGAVYSDVRHVEGPLPAVAPGAIVEIVVKYRDSSAYFTGGIARFFVLGAYVPTERSRIVLDAPSSLPLHYQAWPQDVINVNRTESDGRVRVEFRRDHADKLEDRVPLIPSDVSQWPYVAFSTGASWHEVAAQYERLIQGSLVSASLDAVAKDMVPGAKDRTTIAAALLSWLHKEIRYTGVEFGQNTIVPAPLGEVLKRKYGDCKEQALLLVALLRASGVKANIALLDVGPDFDVLPDMPGMGRFDHAIVYLPPEKGSPAIWIDPTNEFGRPGELSPGVQGRLALVISQSTTGLTKTTEADPADNLELEVREYELSENGSGKVTETMTVIGADESGYRRNYKNSSDKDLKEIFEKYIKSHYQAKKLGAFEFTPAADLSMPFKLKLEALDAGYVNTTQKGAVVTIAFGRIFATLPDFLLEKPADKDKQDSTDSGSGSDADKKAKEPSRKFDLVLIEPFVSEWHCKIVPPPGFRASALPASSKEMIGPTTFTKDYKLNPDGSLSLTLRYDTVRRRFTPMEADAIREAVVKLRDGEALKVTFEQVGETFLSSGNVGQAIKEFRALAKLHPTEALHRIQICRALLAAGLGEEARKEADAATKLEPKNVDAWQNLGWTYQHDLLGRRFRKGFEYDLAVSAYKTAQGIEPDNLVATADLAILLEHDHLGLRYSPASRLGEAILEYQKIKDKVKDTGLANNLPVALLYAHKYQEAKDLVATLKPSVALHGVRLACVAATEGTGNAIELAQKLIADEGDRRQALLRAGNWLEALRLYPQSADLITAGAQGRENATTLLARAEKIRKAVRLEEVPSTPADPIDVIRRNFISWEGGGSLEDFISEYSSSGQAAAKDPKTVDDFNRARFGYLRSALDDGTLPEIFRDVSFASQKFVPEGTASTGYRIKMINTAQDRNPYTYYIVSEGEQCKILGPGGVDSVGKWAITLADKGDLEGARHWLDWARDAIKMRGGEDPLADSPFTHLWTKGDQHTVEDIRLAAASISVLGVDRTIAEPILLSALTGTLTPERRLLVVQALGMASWDMKKWDQSVKCFQELLKRYPRSWVAFRGTAVAMSNLNRWDDLQRLGEERLKAVPDDDDARRLLANLALKRGDAAAVSKGLQLLIDAGKGESGDYNNLAWVLLFDAGTTLSPTCLEYARQAVAMSDGDNSSSLHTLSAVYAEVGKTAEALEVLLKSMDKEKDEEPTPSAWYVIGRIAEQYGETDAALLAYDRVNPKEQPERENPFGTYLLAKRRADALRAKAQAFGTPKRTD